MFFLAKRYRKKIRHCNQDFFKIWTPQTAYWLGLLYADGCITQSIVSKNYAVDLGLKCTDMMHVKKFQTALSSTYALALRDNGKNCICQHRICNDQLSQDLIGLGCIPHKTWNLTWPENLPNLLENHFVRGFFDGDGSIGFSKARKSATIQMYGTYELLANLQICIKRNVQHSSKGHLGKCKSIWRLGYEGTVSPISVASWMYNISTVETRLDRKYEHFICLKSICEEKPSGRLWRYQEFIESKEWKKLIICSNPNCPKIQGKKSIRLY